MTNKIKGVIAWQSLHQSKPVQPVWVIEFEVVKAKAGLLVKGGAKS